MTSAHRILGATILVVVFAGLFVLTAWTGDGWAWGMAAICWLFALAIASAIGVGMWLLMTGGGR